MIAWEGAARLAVSTGDIQYNNLGAFGGSAATVDALGNINALSVTATTVTVVSSLDLQTAVIVDSVGSTGTIGQALESTGTGILWATVTGGGTSTSFFVTATIGTLTATVANIVTATVTNDYVTNDFITTATITTETISNSYISTLVSPTATITTATITGANIVTATVTNDHITNAFVTTATITTETISNSYISTLVSPAATITTLTATTATITTLTAPTLTTTTLSATTATVSTLLTAPVITNTTLTSVTATVSTLLNTPAAIITTATIGTDHVTAGIITTLTATTATISTLVAPTATITTLTATTATITTGNIATLVSPAATITTATITNDHIANAFVTNETVTTLTATTATITTGNIATLVSPAATITTATITNDHIANAFITTATVTSTLELQTATIVDSLGSTGTVGQALESTGTGVKWAAVSSTETWAALTGAMTATQVAPWYNATSTIDSGISRLGAASLAIGNGTAGDFSGTLKTTIVNAVTGFQVNGAAPSGHILLGNGTNYVDSATLPSGTVTWDQIGNAAANLTLANAGFNTTFNQTSAVAWLWANTTTGTALTTNASPLLELAANYYTGSASAADTWTIGSSLAAGTNGASTLTLTHSGSTGNAAVNVPQLQAGTGTFYAAAGVIDVEGAAYASQNAFQLSGSSSSTNLQNDYPAIALINTDTTAGNYASIQWVDNSNPASQTTACGIYGVFTAHTGASIRGNLVFAVHGASGGNSARLTITDTTLNIVSGSALTWNADSGISRLGAASLAIGNGTTGDTSGQITATTFKVAASSAAPTSAGTAGTAGQVIYYGGLLYFCSVTGSAGSATWNKLNMTAV